MSTETQQTPQTPQRLIDDPLLSALAEDLNLISQTERAVEKTEPPPIKPVEDPAATAKTETKPTETKPVEQPIKGSVKPRVSIAEEVKKAVREVLPAPPVPQLPPKQEPAEDKIDTAGLVDAQIEELEDAMYLEKKDPSKKGFAKKLNEFYRSVDKWVADHKDDPDRTFDENDREFTAFLEKSKPKWDGGQRDKIRRDRIVEETKQRALEEVKPQIEQANNMAREAKYGPVLERRLNEAVGEFDKLTSSEDPLEKDVFTQSKETFSTLASDWLRLTEGLDSLQAPRDKQQASRHAWLLNFVANKGAEFEAKGGDAKVRDGKTFLHPAEYGRRRQSGQDVSGHWTFTQDDIVSRLRDEVISEAKDIIQEEEKRATERGFVRQKPAAKPKPAEEPKPTGGIRATTTPAPGAVQPSENGSLDHPGTEVISILGLR